jgi:hypothetical protein
MGPQVTGRSPRLWAAQLMEFRDKAERGRRCCRSWAAAGTDRSQTKGVLWPAEPVPDWEAVTQLLPGSCGRGARLGRWDLTCGQSQKMLWYGGRITACA